MNKEPTFEEGPFFLIKAGIYPSVGQRHIIWATDEDTARSVYERKLNLSTSYCTVSHIGDLKALRDSFRLSTSQIADLHREGYLRL